MSRIRDFFRSIDWGSLTGISAPAKGSGAPKPKKLRVDPGVGVSSVGDDTFKAAPRHQDLALYLDTVSMAGVSVRNDNAVPHVHRPEIVDALKRGLAKGVVLRGLYGSGKSTVLEDVAAAALERGRSVVRLTGQEAKHPAKGIREQLENAIANKRNPTLIIDEFKAVGDPRDPEVAALITALKKAVDLRQCEVLVVLHEGAQFDPVAEALGFGFVQLRPLSQGDLKSYLQNLTQKFGVTLTPGAEEALTQLAVTPRQLNELLFETLKGPVQEKTYGAVTKAKDWSSVWTRPSPGRERPVAVPIDENHVRAALPGLDLSPEMLPSFDERLFLRLLLEPSVRPSTTAERTALALTQTYGISERTDSGDYVLRETAHAWAFRNQVTRELGDWTELVERHRTGDRSVPKQIARELCKVAAHEDFIHLTEGFQAIAQGRTRP